MAVVVASGVSTPGANTKTADLVTGSYQFVQRGKIKLLAKGSAAGINATLIVGGITLINDLPVFGFGTSGTMSAVDNVIVDQAVQGGKVELFLRNTTATAGTTCDYMVLFEPMGGR